MTDKEENKILENLLNDKIKLGKSIDYEYFKELYKPYMNQMTEVEFAELLEIKPTNYESMKYKRHKSKSIKANERKFRRRRKKKNN